MADKSLPFDKEFQDVDGNLIRIYTTPGAQNITERNQVRISSTAFTCELVLNRSSALRFINMLLAAMNAETVMKMKVEPG